MLAFCSDRRKKKSGEEKGTMEIWVDLTATSPTSKIATTILYRNFQIMKKLRGEGGGVL